MQRSESRGQTCLHYAEPRGGKACEAGLTDAAEREQRVVGTPTVVKAQRY